MNTDASPLPSQQPIYVAQTTDPEHLRAPHLWFQSQLDHVDLDKVGWQRMTVSGAMPRTLLIELWETRPENEGQPRFEVAAPQGGQIWPL